LNKSAGLRLVNLSGKVLVVARRHKLPGTQEWIDRVAHMLR
jgi:hypothetical protein